MIDKRKQYISAYSYNWNEKEKVAIGLTVIKYVLNIVGARPGNINLFPQGKMVEVDAVKFWSKWE